MFLHDCFCLFPSLLFIEFFHDFLFFHSLLIFYNIFIIDLAIYNHTTLFEHVLLNDAGYQRMVSLDSFIPFPNLEIIMMGFHLSVFLGCRPLKNVRNILIMAQRMSHELFIALSLELISISNIFLFKKYII